MKTVRSVVMSALLRLSALALPAAAHAQGAAQLRLGENGAWDDATASWCNSPQGIVFLFSGRTGSVLFFSGVSALPTTGVSRRVSMGSGPAVSLTYVDPNGSNTVFAMDSGSVLMTGGAPGRVSGSATVSGEGFMQASPARESVWMMFTGVPRASADECAMLPSVREAVGQLTQRMREMRKAGLTPASTAAADADPVETTGECTLWNPLEDQNGTGSRTTDLFTVTGRRWKVEFSGNTDNPALHAQTLQVVAEDETGRRVGSASLDRPDHAETFINSGPGRYSLRITGINMRWTVRALECR